MKTKYETLSDIVNYVEGVSDEPIDELLRMGFSPCQLINEFGYDANAVMASCEYDDAKKGLDEDIECEDYPFVLSNYSPFDAAIISRFEFSPEDFAKFREAPVYENMKKIYQEEIHEVITDYMNELLDKYKGEM